MNHYMKEVVKMKEKTTIEPMGTMPLVGPMQNMQAKPKQMPEKIAPKPSTVQAAANTLPAQSTGNKDLLPVQTLPADFPTQSNQADLMPYMMNPMPTMNQMPMMCCPFLMNMNCPMLYDQNVMGMGMMNTGNMGYMPINVQGAPNPVMSASNPVMGASNNSMNAYPGMGMMPVTNNPYFPIN